jgi:phospholipid/cholesterol/gamma-HCH transport system permease protein
MQYTSRRALADSSPRLSVERRDNQEIVLEVSGRWCLTEPAPPVEELRAEATAGSPSRITFDVKRLLAWDSRFVAFVAGVAKIGAERNIPVDRESLPPGVRHLLRLAEATPRAPPLHAEARPPMLARVGTRALSRGRRFKEVLAEIGELTAACGRLVAGRGHCSHREVMLQVQLSGARALGIVSLVGFLVGVIIAFVGAVELKRFGATLYVADLVAVVMVRELGALMTAIVLAGRTGAAFAAEIGTMRVTQEVDALTTLGVRPVDYLLLPRVIAVTLVLPLLCLYADLVGLIGGAFIGVGMMDIAPRVYWQQTIDAVSMSVLLGGLFKATIYGLLVASAGCFEGLRAGRSAADVGRAATAAVVDGIVLVIGACGVFAAVFYAIGI